MPGYNNIQLLTQTLYNAKVAQVAADLAVVQVAAANQPTLSALESARDSTASLFETAGDLATQLGQAAQAAQLVEDGMTVAVGAADAAALITAGNLVTAKELTVSTAATADATNAVDLRTTADADAAAALTTAGNLVTAKELTVSTATAALTNAVDLRTTADADADAATTTAGNLVTAKELTVSTAATAAATNAVDLRTTAAAALAALAAAQTAKETAEAAQDDDPENTDLQHAVALAQTFEDTAQDAAVSSEDAAVAAEAADADAAAAVAAEAQAQTADDTAQDAAILSDNAAVAAEAADADAAAAVAAEAQAQTADDTAQDAAILSEDAATTAEAADTAAAAAVAAEAQAQTADDTTKAAAVAAKATLDIQKVVTAENQAAAASSATEANTAEGAATAAADALGAALTLAAAELAAPELAASLALAAVTLAQKDVDDANLTISFVAEAKIKVSYNEFSLASQNNISSFSQIKITFASSNKDRRTQLNLIDVRTDTVGGKETLQHQDIILWADAPAGTTDVVILVSNQDLANRKYMGATHWGTQGDENEKVVAQSRLDILIPANPKKVLVPIKNVVTVERLRPHDSAAHLRLKGLETAKQYLVELKITVDDECYPLTRELHALKIESGKSTIDINIGDIKHLQSQSVSSRVLDTGSNYSIKSLGHTDFKRLGASSNSVGTVFVATSQSSGLKADEGTCWFLGADYIVDPDCKLANHEKVLVTVREFVDLYFGPPHTHIVAGAADNAEAVNVTLAMLEQTADGELKFNLSGTTAETVDLENEHTFGEKLVYEIWDGTKSVIVEGKLNGYLLTLSAGLQNLLIKPGRKGGETNILSDEGQWVILPPFYTRPQLGVGSLESFAQDLDATKTGPDRYNVVSKNPYDPLVAHQALGTTFTDQGKNHAEVTQVYGNRDQDTDSAGNTYIKLHSNCDLSFTHTMTHISFVDSIAVKHSGDFTIFLNKNILFDAHQTMTVTLLERNATGNDVWSSGSDNLTPAGDRLSVSGKFVNAPSLAHQYTVKVEISEITPTSLTKSNSREEIESLTKLVYLGPTLVDSFTNTEVNGTKQMRAEFSQTLGNIDTALVSTNYVLKDADDAEETVQGRVQSLTTGGGPPFPVFPGTPWQKYEIVVITTVDNNNWADLSTDTLTQTATVASTDSTSGSKSVEFLGFLEVDAASIYQTGIRIAEDNSDNSNSMNLKIKRYTLPTKDENNFVRGLHTEQAVGFTLDIDGLPGTDDITGAALVPDANDGNINHTITTGNLLIRYTLTYTSEEEEGVSSVQSLPYPILDFGSDVFDFNQQKFGLEKTYYGDTTLYTKNIMSCSLVDGKNSNILDSYNIEFTAFTAANGGNFTENRGIWTYAAGDPIQIDYKDDRLGEGVKTKFSLTACTPKNAVTHLSLNKNNADSVVYNIQTKTVPAAAVAPLDTKNRKITIGANIIEVDTHQFIPNVKISGAAWTVESMLGAGSVAGDDIDPSEVSGDVGAPKGFDLTMTADARGTSIVTDTRILATYGASADDAEGANYTCASDVLETFWDLDFTTYDNDFDFFQISNEDIGNTKAEAEFKLGPFLHETTMLARSGTVTANNVSEPLLNIGQMHNNTKHIHVGDKHFTGKNSNTVSGSTSIELVSFPAELNMTYEYNNTIAVDLDSDLYKQERGINGSVLIVNNLSIKKEALHTDVDFDPSFTCKVRKKPCLCRDIQSITQNVTQNGTELELNFADPLVGIITGYTAAQYDVNWNRTASGTIKELVNVNGGDKRLVLEPFSGTWDASKHMEIFNPLNNPQPTYELKIVTSPGFTNSNEYSMVVADLNSTTHPVNHYHFVYDENNDAAVRPQAGANGATGAKIFIYDVAKNTNFQGGVGADELNIFILFISKSGGFSFALPRTKISVSNVAHDWVDIDVDEKISKDEWRA